MGGRGSSSRIGAISGVSALEVYKENARQHNIAKIEGKKRRALIVEYQNVDGGIDTLYWNGATYERRKSNLAISRTEFSGKYSAKFKKPKNW